MSSAPKARINEVQPKYFPRTQDCYVASLLLCQRRDPQEAPGAGCGSQLLLHLTCTLMPSKGGCFWCTVMCKLSPTAAWVSWSSFVQLMGMGHVHGSHPSPAQRVQQQSCVPSQGSVAPRGQLSY